VRAPANRRVGSPPRRADRCPVPWLSDRDLSVASPLFLHRQPLKAGSRPRPCPSLRPQPWVQRGQVICRRNWRCRADNCPAPWLSGFRGSGWTALLGLRGFLAPLPRGVAPSGSRRVRQPMAFVRLLRQGIQPAPWQSSRWWGEAPPSRTRPGDGARRESTPHRLRGASPYRSQLRTHRDMASIGGTGGAAQTDVLSLGCLRKRSGTSLPEKTPLPPVPKTACLPSRP
jgi:hypothetical protein